MPGAVSPPSPLLCCCSPQVAGLKLPRSVLFERGRLQPSEGVTDRRGTSAVGSCGSPEVCFERLLLRIGTEVAYYTSREGLSRITQAVDQRSDICSILVKIEVSRRSADRQNRTSIGYADIKAYTATGIFSRNSTGREK